MAGEQTKTTRHGQPRVRNDSGGRFDAEERAHARVEHTGTKKGSVVDLGERGWRRRFGGLVE